MKIKPKISWSSSETVSFPVEQIHILLGERCSSSRCPVALAMHDAGLKEPSVLPDNIYYTDAGGKRRIAHPETKYKDWIRLYDAGHPVSPEMFELEGLEGRLG